MFGLRVYQDHSHAQGGSRNQVRTHLRHLAHSIELVSLSLDESAARGYLVINNRQSQPCGDAPVMGMVPGNSLLCNPVSRNRCLKNRYLLTPVEIRTCEKG